jgi:hypothetical protein
MHSSPPLKSSQSAIFEVLASIVVLFTEMVARVL